jgi:monofunctional biosynthetic peptidoglycan transglycosylase
MERALTKKRVLELYLNVAEWGDGVYGIEAAARKYYGKSASGLTAREAAVLAAVIPNPRRYRTDGTSRYVGNQSERIYQIMVRRGIVIPEYDDVISETDENNEGSAEQKNESNQETVGQEIKSTQVTGEQKEQPAQEEQKINPALPDMGNKSNP